MAARSPCHRERQVGQLLPGAESNRRSPTERRGALVIRVDFYLAEWLAGLIQESAVQDSLAFTYGPHHEEVAAGKQAGEAVSPTIVCYCLTNRSWL